MLFCILLVELLMVSFPSNISFGQALLLKIEAEQVKPNSQILYFLKKTYLLGVKNQHHRDQLGKYLGRLSDKWFKPEVITEDPVRRYFETHFAYEMLAANLDALDYKALAFYYEQALLIFSRALSDEEQQYYYFDIINGGVPGDEFNDIIHAINTSPQYKLFRQKAENQEKLIYLIKLMLLISAVVGAYDADFPLNIYRKGDFKPKNRGRYDKYTTDDKFAPYSKNFGLLKSYMPVPSDDLAFSNKLFSYHKPADLSGYHPQASWLQKQFKLGVHPFSNSISGLMLMQLRFLLGMIELNLPATLQGHGVLLAYFRCFIGLMVFNSGGHSLFEYAAILLLPEVKNAFQASPKSENNFMALTTVSSMSLENLLYGDKKMFTVFDRTLSKTLVYNKAILCRANVRKELLGKVN